MMSSFRSPVLLSLSVIATKGTHVAGTIAALAAATSAGESRAAGGFVGVRGMVPDADNVCLVVARVFGNDRGTATLSDILDAVEWTARRGASVINLSLGGTTYSETGEKFYKELFEDEDRIVVAASGNDGLNQDSYPASYDNVLSVGAVDRNKVAASFSDYGPSLDFVAPGVRILSTTPLHEDDEENFSGGIAVLEVAGAAVYIDEVRLMAYSAVPTKEKTNDESDEQNNAGDGIRGPYITGELVECPGYGEDKCPSPASGSLGHICIIERYAIRPASIEFTCRASSIPHRTFRIL